MAFVLTYNSLVEQVQSYAERTDEDFINEIPTFVTFAINRISKDAKLLGAEKYVVGNFTPNSEVLQKPSLWRTTITFNAGNGTNNNTRNQLLLRSYEYCTAYNPDRSVTGFPTYYCDYAFNNWLVVPTPDAAYPFEIAYIETFEPLDSNNQTNWLTENAPEILLYAVMVEAMKWLKNTEQSSYWDQTYDSALTALVGEDKGRVTDRYTERDKD